MVKLLRRSILLLVLCVVGACGSDTALDPTTPTPGAPAAYVEGEVLVGRKLAATALRAAVREDLLPGGRELERFVLGGEPRADRARRADAETETVEVLRLKIPAGMTVEEAVTQLAERSDLLYAEPNYIVHRAVVPNDEFFFKQWGLENTGQTLSGDKGTYTGTPGVDIGASAAWDMGRGDGSVIVATIDTGIELNHPDLIGNIWVNPGESGGGKENNGSDDDSNGYIDDWQGWNYVANNNNPQDDDLFSPGDLRPLGHGSHVAGIIGATGNNNIGVSGINWNVKLLPLKFLDSIGNGDIANAAKAVSYAVQNGARVINASYEYTGYSTTEYNAINAARTAGVLVVAAAGNEGYNIDNYKVYPAAYALDNIIAIAATDPNDNKASFSNYGITSVDLGAPGVYIYSTVRLDRIGEGGLAGYDYMSGTSMAAPMVSGSVALLWSKYPQLTAGEVRERLFATVDRITSLNGRVATGGRLNLNRAMRNDVNLPPSLHPPTNLSAFSDSSGVHLTWIDNSLFETGFKIERRDENSPTFVELVTLTADRSSYTDVNVVPGGRYVYRVRTFSTTLGDSDYSNELLAQMASDPSSHSRSRTNGYCFIATAAFGTPFMPEVATLRAFRDRVLLTNPPGRLFVALYYRTSPPLADFIAGHEFLRAGVRTLLRPLVWLARMVTPIEAQAMGLRWTEPAAISEDTDVVAGELLVCFHSELSTEAIKTILRAEQSEQIEQIASLQGTLLRIKLPAAVSTSTAQKSFGAYKEVVYAEPNRRVTLRKP